MTTLQSLTENTRIAAEDPVCSRTVDTGGVLSKTSYREEKIILVHFKEGGSAWQRRTREIHR